METGQIIKTLRLMKGVTQNHMADILEISQSAYSQKENSILAFSVNECQTIVKELKLEMMDIFDFEVRYKFKG